VRWGKSRNKIDRAILAAGPVKIQNSNNKETHNNGNTINLKVFIFLLLAVNIFPQHCVLTLISIFAWPGHLRGEGVIGIGVSLGCSIFIYKPRQKFTFPIIQFIFVYILVSEGYKKINIFAVRSMTFQVL